MFPTGVGMNRVDACQGALSVCVPHGCGDEPIFHVAMLDLCRVFPTGVGMNPHGCGDEPVIQIKEIWEFKCSPRVWG